MPWQAQNMHMLGGGNPGQIPEIQQRLRQRMQALLDNGDEFERLVGNYDPPQGNIPLSMRWRACYDDSSTGRSGPKTLP